MGFAGGFTLGMVQAGFKLVGKRELESGFGIRNCEANRHLLGYDWSAETGDSRNWTPVPADVVFGNPPCSGFSVMSVKSYRGANSPANHWMWEFVRYVAKVKPQIAIFESVSVAVNSKDGCALMHSLHKFLTNLTGEQWTLYHVKHNALSLGGAAMRRRYFWVASKVPFGVELPRLRRVPILNDIIGDLESMPLMMSPQTYRSAPTWWSSTRTSPTHYVDGHINVRTPLANRIADLMKEVEWGTGEDIATVARRYYEKCGKLPDSWADSAEKVIMKNFNMGFTTPVRWDGEKYARVITGGSLFNVIHPRFNRLITHREALRIMGFPDDWQISSLKNMPGLALTHGKGITVDCGRWIGSWAKEALDGNPGEYVGTRIDEHVFTIDTTNTYRVLVN